MEIDAYGCQNKQNVCAKRSQILKQYVVFKYARNAVTTKSIISITWFKLRNSGNLGGPSTCTG